MNNARWFLAHSRQDDDADIWNDLTLAFAVPGAKPPNIPKVVKVVSDSDTDDDMPLLVSAREHVGMPITLRLRGGMPSEDSSSSSVEEVRFPVCLCV